MMMLEKIASWEQKLVDWAYEGLESLPPDKLAPPDEDPALIDYAYSHCEKITQVHSRTFFTASSLLPTALCRSVRALYAFCRVSDDLVDRPKRNPREALEMWRKRALSPQPPKDDLVALAWADTRARHRIPLLYAEQLLDGIERDLAAKQVRFRVQKSSPHEDGDSPRPLSVVYTGLETPDLFKDGAEVVVEGVLSSAGPEGVFLADKVLAKCPSKFEAAPEQTVSS